MTGYNLRPEKKRDTVSRTGANGQLMRVTTMRTAKALADREKLEAAVGRMQRKLCRKLHAAIANLQAFPNDPEIILDGVKTLSASLKVPSQVTRAPKGRLPDIGPAAPKTSSKPADPRERLLSMRRAKPAS